MKNKIIFSVMWLLDIMTLLLIIVLPKTEDLFNNLYSVFLVCVFLIPLLLLTFQNFQLSKEENNGYDIYIPSVGCAFLMSLTFIKFISTIKKEVRWQMVFILITFVLLEFLIGYLSSGIEKKDSRKRFYFSAAIYCALVIFFFAAMIMSYDHSINW